MSNAEFGYIKQKLLVEYLLADDSVFQRCRQILKPSYFDNELEKVVSVILEHSESYGSVPTIEQISAEADMKLNIVPAIRNQDQKWALDSIERFCQQGAIVEAVQASPDHIESGNYGVVEKMVKEAMLVSLQKDLGTNYFENPRERLERLKLKNLVPTGWREFDRKLYGGLNRGEITIFSASSGMGKSLFLQNACLNWVSGVSFGWSDDREAKQYAPLDVVYITLELSEDLTSKRMDSMVTGYGATEIYKNLDDVELKVVTRGKKSGEFTIKYMSGANVTTTNDIRAYLKEYEIRMGRMPDCVAVDYLDEMCPNNQKIDASNLFIKDQYITAELRELAVELDVIMVTASQLNRSAVDQSDQNQSMIGGGLSKIQKADNVVTIYASPSMKDRGEYQVKFIKTRSSAGVDSKIFLNFNAASMRISDFPEGYDGGEDTDVKSDGTQLRKIASDAKNIDIIKTIKRGPPKKDATIFDPETGEVIEEKPDIPKNESLTDRLARMRNVGKI